MDRRRFLGLLGAAGAAAIVTPESVRSYFFGPWAPQPSGLVTVIEEWGPGYVHTLVDHKIISVTDAAGVIPGIWDRELLAAVQSRLPLRDAFEWQNELWGVTDKGVYLARREADGISIRDIKPLSELVDPMTIRPAWRYGKLVSVEGDIETRSFELQDELLLAAARERG